MLSDTKVFTAFSSESQLKILESLADTPKGINDIAKDVGLKSLTVRHHIHTLTEAGVIEDIKEGEDQAGALNIFVDWCP